MLFNYRLDPDSRDRGLRTRPVIGDMIQGKDMNRDETGLTSESRRVWEEGPSEGTGGSDPSDRISRNQT